MKANSGNFLSGVIVFLLLAMTLAVEAWAAPPPDIFYVSTSGVDNISRDGSQSEPWRSITYAISRGEVGSGDIINVLDDGDEGSEDYVENITVSKSVKIKGADSNSYKPIVKASNTNLNVFDVTSDAVEITKLAIYGAASAAGVKLNNVSKCLIHNNYCGISSSRRNAYGILISYGSRNVIKENSIDSNTTAGIALWETSGNRIEFNNLLNNANGILVVQSGSANIITFNWIYNNTDSGNGVGIGFGASTNQNIVSGNYIEENDVAIDLDGMAGGIFASNTVRNNGVGIYVPSYAFSNSIFRNNFDENTTNINSAASGYNLGSSAPIFYRYESRYFKSFFGNLYSDYSGSDANGNGIGDTPYSTANYQDSQPLIDSISSFSLHGWALYHSGGIGRLVKSFVGEGDVVTLSPSINKVFSTTNAFTERWIFKRGEAGAQTTWTGWLTFASPPAFGHTIEVTIGTSDAGGANFQALCTQVDVAGNGTSNIFYFTCDPKAFVLPKGKALAVRFRNTGATSLEMMVGGAASMIFAPRGSMPSIPLTHLFL
ncbi:MAG: right-handed parallel beta-helix repeat-containing protein, partial [Deltaproteobacteria bacterium]|nr:right-handed parallel beta-helix repeat-containing protein [Deltaproteobacteria bacterium]